MVKTEFYIAGGTVSQMSKNLNDCEKIGEIEGLLYDCNQNIEKWVEGEVGEFSSRTVMLQKDYISAKGILRIVIFSTKKQS